MKEHLVETLVGAAVIAVAVIFLSYAYSHTEQTSSAGYTLTAKVQNAAGITVGTDVRIAGIKVGTVTDTHLDPITYQAILEFTVEQGIELPEDSSMKVAIEGLLGGNFIAVSPGGDFDNLLGDGGEIIHAQGSIDIIGLIQRFAFGGVDDGE